MKIIKGDLGQVAVILLQLLKDDSTLLLDLRLLQSTVLHNVSQELYNCNTFLMLAILLPSCYPGLLKEEKTHRQQGHRNERATNHAGEEMQQKSTPTAPGTDKPG